jgi:tRNA(Ile)-lysidine synthase TilS/MesJ
MACHLQIPHTIRDLLEQGAHVLVNVSGGKDSDAMLKLLWDASCL